MRMVLLLLLCAAMLSAAAPAVHALDGMIVHPFEPTGGAGVVFFLCTDCAISNGYAPEIQRICASYQSKRVACTLIYEDVDVKPAAVRRHLAEYGFGQFTAAIDTDRTAAKYARAKVTPTAVLVDSHGSIRYRGRINNLYASLGRPRQQVTEHDLNNALDAVLTGQPVAKPETQALGCYIVDPAVLRK